MANTPTESKSFSLGGWISDWWHDFTDWRNWKIWTILRLKQQESPLTPPFSNSLVQTEGVQTRHRRLSKAIQTVATEANIPAAEQLSLNELLGSLVKKTAEGQKQPSGSTLSPHCLNQKEVQRGRGPLSASKSVEKPQRSIWRFVSSLFCRKAKNDKKSPEEQRQQTLHVS